MQENSKPWILAFLILTGCVFLSLAGWNVLTGTDTTTTPNYMRTGEHIDLTQLNSETFELENWAYKQQRRDARYRAIFVVPGDQCNSCLNDVQSYLEDLADSELNGEGIARSVFFQTLDEGWARRAATIYGFDVPIMYGDETVLGGSLSSYGDVSIPCQIVLIDAESDMAFFRVLLEPRHSTPTMQRQQYLQQARVAGPNGSG